MEQRFSKPRVFLSHSKKNTTFIERVAEDLRKSQIDPWLDTDEIRHGKSWQDSIFEYGLPTCDAILVYFTEFSIQSPVVKKEIDVGLLQKLKDNNVAFLPYVDNAKIRDLLRPDIQALQTLEWNDQNYYALLPRVVAEIWRSFLERTISAATKDERLKRIELELELEKQRNQTDNFFSLAENSEFDFIWNSFDIVTPLTIQKIKQAPTTSERTVLENYSINLNLSTLIPFLARNMGRAFHKMFIDQNVLSQALIFLSISKEEEKESGVYYIVKGLPEITERLIMYGLIERFSYPAESFGRTELKYENVFSQKYFRYIYWLTFNKKMPASLDFSLEPKT